MTTTLGRGRALCLAALLGCKPTIPPPPPDVVEPPLPPLDMATVEWPEVPDPLPTGAPPWIHGFEHPAPPTALPQLSYDERRYVDDGLTGDLGATVLLCTLSFTSTYDHDPRVFGGGRSRADLALSGRANGGPEFVAVASKNSKYLSFSAPVPAFPVGGTLELRIVDRDPLVSDALGRLTVTYDGTWPMRAESGRSEVQCSALPSERVSSMGGIALERTDRYVARLMQTLELRPDDSGFDQFRDAVETFRGAVRWLGWTPDEIQLRRARLDALIDEHRDRVLLAADAQPIWGD